MDRNKLQLIIMAGLGLVTGFSAGYLVANKRAQTKWEKIANEEIESTKQAYRVLRKTDEFATPEAAAESLGREELNEQNEKLGYDTTDFIKTLQDQPIENMVTEDAETIEALIREQAEERGVTNITTIIVQPTDEDDEPDLRPMHERNQNVFDQGVEIDGEDLNKRGTGVPYIITVDEYMNDEENYDKLTVTYYEEDDVLVDSRESQIPDIENTVGSGNLHRFGHGSDSMDSVYVRNDERHVDFEIVRDPRSYAEMVLGIVSRPPKPPLKKMRSDD